MNWYHLKTFKYASVETGIIKRLGLGNASSDEDILLCVLIYKMAKRKDIPWTDIKDKKQLNNFILKRISEIEKKVNDESSDLYLTDKESEILVSIDVEIAKDSNKADVNRMLRAVLANEDVLKELAFKNKLYINRGKRNGFLGWLEHLKNNFSPYPAFIFMLMDYLVEEVSPHGQKTIPPFVDSNALDGLLKTTIDHFKSTKQPIHINNTYASLVDQNEEKLTGENNIQKTTENGKWVKLNYDGNGIKMMQFYGSLAGWCTSLEELAGHYLSQGPTFIYVEKGLPKIIITQKTARDSFVVLPDGTKVPVSQAKREDKINYGIEEVSIRRNGKRFFVPDETRGKSNLPEELALYWKELNSFLKEMKLDEFAVNADGYEEGKRSVEKISHAANEAASGNEAMLKSLSPTEKYIAKQYVKKQWMDNIRDVTEKAPQEQVSPDEILSTFTPPTGIFSPDSEEISFAKQQFANLLDGAKEVSPSKMQSILSAVSNKLPGYLKDILNKMNLGASTGRVPAGAAVMTLEQLLNKFVSDPQGSQEILKSLSANKGVLNEGVRSILLEKPQYMMNERFKNAVRNLISPDFFETNPDLLQKFEEWKNSRKKK